MSTVKLIKRIVIMRVKDNGAQEDDALFPALRGKAVEKRAVSYSTVSSIFKSMLLELGWSLQKARNFGLHIFRIGAITTGVESGALNEDHVKSWKMERNCYDLSLYSSFCQLSTCLL